MSELPVFFATTDGQTRRIAEALTAHARFLGVNSYAIDVTSAQAAGFSWARVGAVVVAASVHAGRHQPEAEAFVRRHLAELNARPSVFLSVSLAISSRLPGEADAARGIASAFPEHLGWKAGRVACVAGRLACNLHAVDDLLGAPAVRAGTGVGPHDQLQPAHRERVLEHLALHRNALLGEGEALFVEIADAQVAGLVLEIVLRHEPDVRLEPGAVLLHQLELGGGRLAAVGHRRASRQRRGADRRRAVRMDPRAQPERLRFRAGRLNLCIGHRLRPAFAAALRREQLHEVGAVGFHLADERPDLVGRAGVLVDRTNRREQARTGHDAAGDRGAEIDIGRRPDALHRREAGRQRDPRVLDRIQHRLLRCFALAGRAPDSRVKRRGRP